MYVQLSNNKPVIYFAPDSDGNSSTLTLDGVADENLLSSHIVTYVYDENGSPISDLVGVLFKNGEPFMDDNSSIFRGVSDSNGLLIIDFDLIPTSLIDAKPTCKTRKNRINNKLWDLFQKNMRRANIFTRKYKNFFKNTRKKRKISM